jgi:hypothetical protein
MPWLPNYDTGKTPAEQTAGISIHGGNLPSELLRRKKSLVEIIAEGVQQNAPAVAAYLKEKNLDKVANALMNSENAPRAEAVDPSLQNVGGFGPATRPFTGGAMALAQQDMIQQRENAIEDRKFKLAKIQADIERSQRAPVGRGNPAAWDQEHGMTTAQWQAHLDRVDRETRLAQGKVQKQKPFDPSLEAQKKIAEDYGMTRDQFVEYMPSVRAGEPDPASGEFVGNDKGTMYQFDSPDGPVTMPKDDFNKFKRLFTAQAPVTAAQIYQNALPRPEPRQAMGGYIPGRRYAGKTYLGGDPNDPNNWQ